MAGPVGLHGDGERRHRDLVDPTRGPSGSSDFSRFARCVNAARAKEKVAVKILVTAKRVEDPESKIKVKLGIGQAIILGWIEGWIQQR